MSVSRDVLESVEASQICFCNVDEDTIGWRRRQHYRQGFMFRSAFKLLVGRRVHETFGSLPLQIGRAPVSSKTPKCKLRKHKNILRKLI